MRKPRTALFAGIAALSLAGAASAQNLNTMTVRLPSGGVAEIRYAGNVPPQVVVLPGPAAMDGGLPVSSMFGSESPFAMMERISAEMDRRTAAMLRYAEAAAEQARVSAASPYTYTGTMPGSGFCMRSVRITQSGGSAPHVESYSAGDCGGAAATPGSAVRTPVGPVIPSRQPGLLYTQTPARPAAPAPAATQRDLLLTQNSGPSYAGMVRQASSAPR